MSTLNQVGVSDAWSLPPLGVPLSVLLWHRTACFCVFPSLQQKALMSYFRPDYYWQTKASALLTIERKVNPKICTFSLASSCCLIFFFLKKERKVRKDHLAEKCNNNGLQKLFVSNAKDLFSLKDKCLVLFPAIHKMLHGVFFPVTSAVFCWKTFVFNIWQVFWKQIYTTGSQLSYLQGLVNGLDSFPTHLSFASMFCSLFWALGGGVWIYLLGIDLCSFYRLWTLTLYFWQRFLSPFLQQDSRMHV